MGKNLKMENKELQKNAEIQMKKMEEMRRINEGLEKNCSVLEDSLKEQIKQITRLEKEKNTLEDEKRDKLAKYKTEMDEERDEIEYRFTELQVKHNELQVKHNELQMKHNEQEVKYSEAQEHLKRAQLRENTAISGDDEEVNMLQSKCFELELELKSKNTQLGAQEIDLNSKEEKIVVLEEKVVNLEKIKVKRMKEAKTVGDTNKRCMEAEASRKELEKVLEEKESFCAEILKASEGKDNERLELQKALDEKDKDYVRLQNLLNEKQKLPDEKQNENVQLIGEREALEKKIKQTHLETLETLKAQCLREKEEKERISAKANLLEKELGAKETEITAMRGLKERVVAEADQLRKKVKEKETECENLVSEKKKAVTEADTLKRRLKDKDDMETAKMDEREADVLKIRLKAAETELANARQSAQQMNDHTVESSRDNADKTATNVKIEEIQTALAEQEEFKKALQKELTANQDHLRKIEKESMKKEERLQEKDSVIKILKQGQDGNSVTLAKKIHKQKARLKLQDEMLSIRAKEIEMLRKMVPPESESEEEREDRDRKETSSKEQKDENGVEEEGSFQSSQSFTNTPIPHYTEELPSEILEKAKQLKHRADKAECITTKVQSYLSAIWLFIKVYLVTNNKDGTPISKEANNKVLKQTHNLTKHVYKLCLGKVTSEEHAKHQSIYTVLVLRAQSIIESHLRQQNVDNSNGNGVPPSNPTWKLADQLVSQSDDCTKDLFAKIDKECGSLAMQSSLGQLVGYLETTLQKLPKSA